MRFKFTHITDVPDMIPDAVGIRISIIHPVSRDVFTHLNGFQHRTIGKPASAGIVHFARPGVLIEIPEHINQVIAMDVVPYLLSFIAKYRIGVAGDAASHQVG